MKGFTLIEVLVSISVLLFVVFLPLSIIADYLANNSATRMQVQAQLRAQEVIEYVRLQRDNSVLDPEQTAKSWFSSLNESTSDFNSCVVNTASAIKYCEVRCLNDVKSASAEKNDCSKEETSFVWGVDSVSMERGGNKDTCDGKEPKDNDRFTLTLKIIVPEINNDVVYSIINPCISWQQPNGNIQKLELRETLFEWTTL